MDIEEIKKIIEEAQERTCGVVGLRYDNRDLQPGDKLEASRDNPGRKDERDFPEYESPEYEELEELDGTSAWELMRNQFRGINNSFLEEIERIVEEGLWGADYEHAYIVAGEYAGVGPDHGECLIKNCEVVMQIV